VISSFSVHDPDGPDADHCDDPADVTDPDGPQSRSGIDSGAVAPVSEADEEDEVAKAEARAEAARVRLVQLRQAAKTGDADEGAVSQSIEQRPVKSARKRLRLPRRPGRPRWLLRPGRKTITVGIGIVLASASLGASGYMVWLHHVTVHKQQLAAEFAAAARQGVTALLSIDANHVRDDFQRMIDDSTGDFKNQLSAMSGLRAQQAEESKVSSKGTVEAVAVESISDDSAVVLVAAKSDVTNADNTKRPTIALRISVGLMRDGGQPKMSKVDFLQ
jgi:Mce-associated membrane protein